MTMSTHQNGYHDIYDTKKNVVTIENRQRNRLEYLTIIEVKQVIKEHAGNVPSRCQGLTRFGMLFLGCWGVSAPPPSWGQAPMPPAPARQEAAPALPDPFYNALDALSQKYHVAFVAEGRPFLAGRNSPAPRANTEQASGPDPIAPVNETPPEEAANSMPHNSLSAEEAEVQKVAAQFDYDFLHQGSVYLLQKRYSNPEDLPEVTPEECRLLWLHCDPVSSRTAMNNGFQVMNHREKQIASAVNAELLNLTRSRRQLTQLDFVHAVLYGSGGSTLILSQGLGRSNPTTADPFSIPLLMHDFVLGSYSDRIRATSSLLANSRPLDPVFHWQTLGQSPVFGYDTQFDPQTNPLFIPASDCDRIVVAPYGTPMPRPDFWMRTETHRPDPDPTDPKTLSPATKRFLDDHGRSSRAVTIAEALVPINKKVPKNPGYKIYAVDRAFAAKRVTLVGTDKLSPETFMQSLAAVYNLSVEHRRDDHVVLTWKPILSGRSWTYGQSVRASISDPIYRVIHARFLAGRTKTQNQEGPQLLEFGTQYEFQRIAASFRNTAMRQFRYLAEPQVKAQPKEKLPLSRLGEREHTLFMFAQTVSVYAAACEAADIPLPPYLIVGLPWDADGIWAASVKISGGVYRKGGSPGGPYIYDPFYFSRITYRATGRDRAISDYSCPDDTARLALFVTYVNPQSGVAWPPAQFLDVSLYLPDLQ